MRGGGQITLWDNLPPIPFLSEEQFNNIITGFEYEAKLHERTEPDRYDYNVYHIEMEKKEPGVRIKLLSPEQHAKPQDVPGDDMTDAELGGRRRKTYKKRKHSHKTRRHKWRK